MPPIPVRELTSTYARRYSNTARLQHGNFHLGMQRDIASWESPDGACWSAVDMICDIVGKIRKRGGYTSPSSSNRTAVVENILGYKSGGVDQLAGLWGSLGKAGASIVTIDRTTGAATTLAVAGSLPVFACRPFQHENLMVFSFQALGTTVNDINKLYFSGGTATAGAGSTNCTMTAGSNVVTGLAGITAGMVGGLFSIWNIAGNKFYAGRVVSFISATSVRIEPTPSISSGATNDWQIAPVHDPNFGGFSTLNLNDITGRYGLSFQGRIVLGYTLRNNPGALLSNTGLDVKPYRVAWTQLQSDAIDGGGTFTFDGNAFLYPSGFVGSPAAPTYNYLDFPELGPPGITGLAAAGEGTLLVFGRAKTMRITGPLSTETQLNPDPTYTKSQISANVGCISDRSIQYTPMGIIFAALDNLYLYDGAKMSPLLGANAHYYQARLRAGDTIYGSAYFSNRNHYYLSMSGADGGLCFNLSGMQMTKLTNMPLFDSTPDPTDATQLWGVGWWDTTAAAPTFTKGQLIRLDPIFLPAASNISDGNGTAVLHVLETKSYPDGELPAKKRYTQARFGFDQRGGTTTLVQADTQLNTSDAAYVSVGSLAAGTEPQSVGFQTLPLLKKGQAIEFKLTSQAACTSFELTQLEVSVQQPRGGRSN